MSETESTPPEPEPGTEAGDDDEEAAEHESAPEPDESVAQAAARAGSDDIPKKLERALTDQRKRLERIIGVDLAGKECATCDGMGYVPEGVADIPPLVYPDNLERCDRCNGHGQLGTPSLVPGQEAIVCTGCAGLGYVTKTAQPSNVTPIAPASPTAEAAQMGTLLPDGRFLPFGASEPIPVAQTYTG